MRSARSSFPTVRAACRPTGPGRFAHSLIPIGYLVAHYFSLFVFDGQRAVILLSDPLDTGVDLFGVATRSVDLSAVSPATIAVVQVLGIVTGMSWA